MGWRNSRTEYFIGVAVAAKSRASTLFYRKIDSPDVLVDIVVEVAENDRVGQSMGLNQQVDALIAYQKLVNQGDLEEVCDTCLIPIGTYDKAPRPMPTTAAAIREVVDRRYSPSAA